jgi:hypothetical protein
MEDIPIREQQIQNLKNGQNVVISMPQLTEFRVGEFEARRTSVKYRATKTEPKESLKYDHLNAQLTESLAGAFEAGRTRSENPGEWSET